MAFDDKLIAWRQNRASREEAFHEWAKKWGLPAAGAGGGYFFEFPHTNTYDSDLSWLIARMLWVLNRMDDVEQRMAALEDLVDNFIETLNIDEVIKENIISYFNQILQEGTFEEIIRAIFGELLSQIEYVRDNSFVFPNTDSGRVNLVYGDDISAIFRSYKSITTGELTVNQQITAENIPNIDKTFVINFADCGKFVLIETMDNIDTGSQSTMKGTQYFTHKIRLTEQGYNKIINKAQEINLPFTWYSSQTFAYETILNNISAGTWSNYTSGYRELTSSQNTSHLSTTHYTLLRPKILQ